MTTYVACSSHQVFLSVCMDKSLDPYDRDVVYVIRGTLLGRRYNSKRDRVIERWISRGRMTDNERAIREELHRFKALDTREDDE